MQLVQLKANGSPTKLFFVDMITRDITLEDCILDLVDNSIDGAWKLEGGQPTNLMQQSDLSKYSIEITVSEDVFSISDNCGGIPLSEAQNYAFTFGRKEDDSVDKYSIGVYGIGMKRAVFKIGRDISVRSNHTAGGVTESFAVGINVEKWLDQADWDFPIKEVEPLPHSGVRIQIKDLNEDTATSFRTPNFIQNLRRTLARDYTIQLHHGLNITLNGVLIEGWQVELRQSDDFSPVRVSYQDDVEQEVHVELLGGMAAPPPEGDSADEVESGDRFGWYVVCNGRVVLAADKGVSSGWGTEGWPQWHGQYNGFIGLVMFSSENAKLLPMTTTKRNVDTASGVYRRAQPAMRELSKKWTAYTNARKQALDEAKAAESKSKAVSIFDLPVRSQVALPRLTVVKKEPVANISYSVPLPRFRRLAAAVGDVTMNYRELGQWSFDYTYREHVGDE